MEWCPKYTVTLYGSSMENKLCPDMMTSSNGNIFHITGPLCGEFTGHWWIPHTKASDAELWCFLWSSPWINSWVNNGEAGDLRRHLDHYDIIVIKTPKMTILLSYLWFSVAVYDLLSRYKTKADLEQWILCKYSSAKSTDVTYKWISNYIHLNLWDVIVYPCHNFRLSMSIRSKFLPYFTGDKICQFDGFQHL